MTQRNQKRDSLLICLRWNSPFHSSAVGVGFYGNSETNDGVYQLTYSLYNANHTLESIDNMVRPADRHDQNSGLFFKIMFGV